MVIETGFTGGTLDRADALRHDPPAVATLLADPASRLLRLDAFEPVVADDGTLSWSTIAEAPDGAATPTADAAIRDLPAGAYSGAALDMTMVLAMISRRSPSSSRVGSSMGACGAPK